MFSRLAPSCRYRADGGTRDNNHVIPHLVTDSMNIFYVTKETAIGPRLAFKVIVVVVFASVADAESLQESVDEVDAARRSDTNDCREDFHRVSHLRDERRRQTVARRWSKVRNR